jgi:membrane-bound metal-dependent hydrolase YbcI (DUF457 family)
MFVGHIALALCAKRAAPAVSLGWLVAAVVALDLIWPLLVLSGLEQVRISRGATAFTPFIFESYPWSHSLVMAVVWGIALAGVARWRGIPASAGFLLVILVVSHWVLDVVTHAPDMPLWPGDSPRLGLGLWNSIVGTLVIEGSIWIAGIMIYRSVRHPAGRTSVAFWSLVVVATVLWASGPWGPLPSSSRELGWFGLISWLLIPWAALADRSPMKAPSQSSYH